MEWCHSPSAQSSPKPRDPDDSITSLVIAVHQVDDQFLKTIPCNKEVTSLLGSSYNIENGEVLALTGIRNKVVAEGLEAQDDALAPATN